MKKTSKAMGAPGLNGILAFFYQTYWGIIVKVGITLTIVNVLNNERDPKEYTQTYIYLIPKTNNPTTPYEYKPRTLCNILMKITTKTIANRMKDILPHIIS